LIGGAVALAGVLLVNTMGKSRSASVVTQLASEVVN